MNTKELLALGVFGRGSRLGERVAMLLERGREFSARIARGRIAVGGVALAGCLIAAALTPKWIALAQAPVRFDVASVKPMTPEQRDRGRQLTCEAGREFLAKNTLFWLVFFAYHVTDDQILGGPPWMKSDDVLFDVEAKPASPPVNPDDCRKMVQTLLAERFKLALHKETREMQVYALAQTAKGAKLHAAGADEPKWPGSAIMINGAALQINDNYDRGTARGMTMRQLAGFLQGDRRVARLVVDETNLTGVYSLTLDYAEKADDDKPDLFTALQEQLGLKLESKKEPVEVLVIDHAEKPEEN